MLRTASSKIARSRAARGLKAMVRERFSLGDDDTVSVAEIACGLPGCPPVETCITFWTQGGTRHHFKIFKPLVEASGEDLPPYWMRDALIRDTDDDCC